MGLEVGTLMAINAAISVAGAAVTYHQSEKARSAQREAGRVSEATQRAEAVRAGRAKARQARVRRAQMLQAGEGSGILGSSGINSALGSIHNNQAQQASYFGGQKLAADGITRANQQSADAQFRGQIAGGLTDLFTSGIGLYTSNMKPTTDTNVLPTQPRDQRLDLGYNQIET